MPNPDVVIVGAGLAGLCCGRRLAQCGVPFQILEVEDAVGGRVRTDDVDGFRLDRGFQFYAPASPEGGRVLDLPPLDLRPLSREVLVRFGGRFHRVADPQHHPLSAAASFLNPIGTPADKCRLIRFAARRTRETPGKTDENPDELTLDSLRWKSGFGPSIIDRFFRPLAAALIPGARLDVSGRSLRELLKSTLSGGIAIPSRGMRAVPDQLAGNLPPGTIRLSTRVDRVSPGTVDTPDGPIECRAVVLATGCRETARLLDDVNAKFETHETATVYFSADRSPLNAPSLVLNGDGAGPVNHLVVVSDIAAEAAPIDQSLIAVGVVRIPTTDEQLLESETRRQLTQWYGSSVCRWKHLRTYRASHAKTVGNGNACPPYYRTGRLNPGLYACGPQGINDTLDDGMGSGFRVAQAVLQDLAEERV